MSQPKSEPVEVVEPQDPPRDPAPEEALIDDELLVEDVSIDGMCGVY